MTAPPASPPCPDAPFDPRDRFASFYGNDAVRHRLASRRRWTISGQIGNDEARRKAPLDIQELISTGRLWGARWNSGTGRPDEDCLATLDDLTGRMPTAANCAFFLRAQHDGVVIIDIEPGCPPEIAAPLLNLDEVLYSEMSMSGKGYHLIAPLPENFWDHPNAASKTVLREQHGWYEILLQHWVTFTRTPIPDDRPIPGTAHDVREATLVDVYADLAQSARATVSSTTLALQADRPDIPFDEEIVDSACKNIVMPVLERFDHDRSRWEFSILSRLEIAMAPWIEMFSRIADADYDESARTWLLYDAAQRVIPERDKHHEQRNRRPYLLDRAAALIAERTAQPTTTEAP